MTLPRWNDDWEKPDPLRGKRGWTGPDYVNISVAVGLVVIAFGLLVPALARIHDTESRERRINTQRERELSVWPPDLVKQR
jgi:hypothetical protein